MPICEAIKIGAHEITHYNDHNPHEFVQKLMEKNDEELLKFCKDFIWLSAYANNNPRSDYHFMSDACYDECQRRNKPEIYQKAYDAIERSI